MAMKEISFTASESDIELARKSANGRKTTLDELFREWLREIAEGQTKAHEFRALMKRLDYVNPGRKFTRDEMNER